MTKIKLCGLSRVEDIQVANEIFPEFIGFVFAKKSRRYVTQEKAAELKKFLRKEISAVGVFVNEKIEVISELANKNIIDVIQLHGSEDEKYIDSLRNFTDKKIIQAFKIQTADDLKIAEKSSADFILLDGGAGDGKIFNWQILKNFSRKYFLAGGLNLENVSDAIKFLKPFAVDVSSGIETDGLKDKNKMREFVKIVRGEF
ncbi:MAG: phosphoribosylanthranilate isomerase [Selenomonadaceae bacterium]|nr:phosphoribosylanthranilate isomerase [Selenomonadaceae bacterium]